MLIVLNLTHDKEADPGQFKVMPLIVSLCTGAALIYATGDMPLFGAANAPVHLGDTVQYYLNQGYADAHLPNLVTTVLASYRGYDTLGETTVVFTAAVAVMLLLGRAIPKKNVLHAVKSDSVALVGAKMLIPYILLFALYVQFHGDFGPGGGFQAGVMFAAAFILHGMVRSLSHTREAAPSRIIEILVALGVILYAATGVLCMAMGGRFLEYNVLAHDPVHGQHYGILLVEAGVGITVFAAILIIFYKFALRGRK
jgi:multicomponent Na+:H+ antiporter subunit B